VQVWSIKTQEEKLYIYWCKRQCKWRC
jgi:hypothetical protein